MKSQTDPKIDAYIAECPAFAQPILKHLRELVHKSCPEVQEGIKWQFPFFMYQGNLCFMAAFKAHCGFGFWAKEMRVKVTAEIGKGEEGLGHFGRLTSLADLPKDQVLLAYLKEAKALNESGKAKHPRPQSKKKAIPVPVPEDLAAALSESKPATARFKAFPESHRREYIEWIVEAKREATRANRIAQTVAWIAEGKSRNWRYQ
jgi:uncharacterized protein YdeI (YjbR/CyaY-like superfamily)